MVPAPMTMARLRNAPDRSATRRFGRSASGKSGVRLELFDYALPTDRIAQIFRAAIETYLIFATRSDPSCSP